MQTTARNAQTVCVLSTQVKKLKWTPKTYPAKTFLGQSTQQVRELPATKLPRSTRKRIMYSMGRAAHNGSDTMYYRTFGVRYHILSDLWVHITRLCGTLAVARKTQKREFQPASASLKTRKRSQRTASLISTFAQNKGSNDAAHFNFPRRSNNTARDGNLGNQTSVSNMNGNKAASPSAKGLTMQDRNVLKAATGQPSNNTTRTAPPSYTGCGPITTPNGQY